MFQIIHREMLGERIGQDLVHVDCYSITHRLLSLPQTLQFLKLRLLTGVIGIPSLTLRVGALASLTQPDDGTDLFGDEAFGGA